MSTCPMSSDQSAFQPDNGLSSISKRNVISTYSTQILLNIMETYHTTTTTLCLLLTIAVSEPLRVRRDTNATGEELATQRGMLLTLRLINEVGYHLDTFRDRVYGEVEQFKTKQEKILSSISDIQTQLNGGSGLPVIPSVHTTTTTPATNNQKTPCL